MLRPSFELRDQLNYLIAPRRLHLFWTHCTPSSDSWWNIWRQCSILFDQGLPRGSTRSQACHSASRYQSRGQSIELCHFASKLPSAWEWQMKSLSLKRVRPSCTLQTYRDARQSRWTLAELPHESPHSTCKAFRGASSESSPSSNLSPVRTPPLGSGYRSFYTGKPCYAEFGASRNATSQWLPRSASFSTCRRLSGRFGGLYLWRFPEPVGKAPPRSSWWRRLHAVRTSFRSLTS